MKKHVLSVLTVLCLLLGALAIAKAQEASKKEPGPAAVMLRQWNDVGKKLVAMAEDFPEDKYDYRPNDKVRTFAQQLLHAAASMYYATNSALGKPTDKIEENPSRDTYKTKAQVVAFVKKCVEDGAAAIQQGGDAGVVKHIDDWSGLIEHSGEHYGQLVVYYRNNGLVPPESRKK
jgi:DinB family protein